MGNPLLFLANMNSYRKFSQLLFLGKTQRMHLNLDPRTSAVAPDPRRFQGFGSVEIEEFWKLFRRCDRNADGHISKSELVQLIEVVFLGRHYGRCVGVFCG